VSAAGAGRSRGRPTRLTKEIHYKIVGYILSGALFKDAVMACGIPEATAYEWIARGEGRDPKRASTPQYEAFARDVREAEAVPMVIASNWLFDNKKDVWLSRRDPKSWGPNGRASHHPNEEES
jgi:hypothetical protein